jgi:HEAT repeat protein
MTVLVDRGAYADAVSEARAHGREPKLEKALAEVLLEEAARSNDSERRGRAFAELSLAGTRSRPVLDRLHDHAPPLTRALAWAASMQLGNDGAREKLRALASSDDPELSALGVAALEPVTDRRQLLAVITEPNRARRAAAVRVLQGSPISNEVKIALEAVVQHDPDAGVRSAAVMALAKQGPDAAPAVERAVDDESEAVRLAAFSALGTVLMNCVSQPAADPAHTCDRERLLRLLGRDLGNPPTAQSLAAASAMLRAPNPPEPDRARAVFTRALEGGDGRLRALAAVLCRSEDNCEAAVMRERLRVEPIAQVKLLLALAIGPRDPLAHTALEVLSTASDPQTAVEAASELAADGDSAAQQKLLAALKHTDAGVRVSALRALGRLSAQGAISEDGTTSERMADHLADPDEHVRFAAAAAVLGFG